MRNHSLLGWALVAFSAFFFSCSEASTTLEDLRNDPTATEHYIPDDGYVEVPLDFEFPFYGRTFTNSWMFSNGVIGFLDPTQAPYQGQYGFCCTGYDNSVDRPATTLTLMPLQTDLINYGDGKFMTRGDEHSMTYGWYGISEYGRPNSSNNFEAEIYDDGMYQFRYGNLDVNRDVTIGSTGDPSAGEYEQYLYGLLPPNGMETITSYGLGGMCVYDPLFDPNCPGYADAYAELQYQQNCMADPLYDPGCPGYAQAYYTQQCSADPLYDSGCPGYEEALFEQQCSADPLYNEDCPGYQDAYFEYQCEQNTLYDSGCPGYEQAFFDYQCEQDTLYDSGCPGYEAVYFSQQCSNDALYDSGCPGYEEAFAQQQLERTCSADPQSDPRCDEYTQPSEEIADSSGTGPSAAPKTDPDDLSKPELTGDSTVDSILRDGADNTNNTMTQQRRQPVPVPAIEPTPIKEREPHGPEQESSTRDEEEKADDTPDRRKKLKEIAERKARDLANEMGKAASVEQQMATQARVMSLISYVPGFGAYAQKGIPQPSEYYASDSIYDDREIPDSNFGARNGLAQEILHKRMVDMQYNNNNN